MRTEKEYLEFLDELKEKGLVEISTEALANLEKELELEEII